MTLCSATAMEVRAKESVGLAPGSEMAQALGSAREWAAAWAMEQVTASASAPCSFGTW